MDSVYNAQQEEGGSSAVRAAYLLFWHLMLDDLPEEEDKLRLVPNPAQENDEE